jgi:hypothetical protein
LKTVLCTTCDDPRATRKLLHEVRHAQDITHPNVCRIHELHEHRDARGSPPVQFLTMEFIDGEKLGQRLRSNGAIPIADAEVIAMQLLSGLKAAHARGVLHLDFKSDNVMLRREGEAPQAVILDFGLSRGTSGSLGTSERQEQAGSVHYMSPEQVQCRPDLSTETDVYAFGVVLFEMLTGTLPFVGGSRYEIMLKRLKEQPPPPSSVLPGLPTRLDEFALRCLSADPRRRYPDAESALAALERLRTAKPGHRSARRGRRLVLATLAAAVVGGVVTYLTVVVPSEFGATRRAARSADASRARVPAREEPRTVTEHSAVVDAAPRTLVNAPPRPNRHDASESNSVRLGDGPGASTAVTIQVIAGKHVAARRSDRKPSQHRTVVLRAPPIVAAAGLDPNEDLAPVPLAPPPTNAVAPEAIVSDASPRKSANTEGRAPEPRPRRPAISGAPPGFL